MTVHDSPQPTRKIRYHHLRHHLSFPAGHKSLPLTYFQICGMDPLRDDSFIYERILREECAVKTRVDFYPGLPHSFWSWFPEATFSKKQLKDSMEGMAWLLESK